MALEPTLVRDDASIRIVVWSRVLAQRWRATPTPEALDALGHAQQDLIRSTLDGRIYVISVISPKMGMLLSGEARNKAEAVAGMARDNVAALAQVVEGDGFKSAAARAVMSGVQLAIRAPYPVKVFDTIASGFAWIEKALREAGHARDAHELAEVMTAALREDSVDSSAL